jgi:hypothetical protein
VQNLDDAHRAKQHRQEKSPANHLQQPEQAPEQRELCPKRARSCPLLTARLFFFFSIFFVLQGWT